MFVFFPVIYRVCFRRAWQSPRAEGPSFALRIMVGGLVWHVSALPFDTRNALALPKRIAHTLHDKTQARPMSPAKICTRNKLFARWQYLDLGMLLA